MAHFVILAMLACSFGVVSSAPVVNSTTLRQNALDAQTLNTEFMQLQVTDACNCTYEIAVAIVMLLNS